MNERIVLPSVGGFGSLMAFSLFLPGLIPSGVSVKPRYENSLLPKKHVSKFIFKLCVCSDPAPDQVLADVCCESEYERVSHQSRP